MNISLRNTNRSRSRNVNRSRSRNRNTNRSRSRNVNRSRSRNRNVNSYNHATRYNQPNIKIVERDHNFEFMKNGEVIATASYNINRNVFYITNIFVKKTHRGKGTGKYVLNHLLKFAFSNKDIDTIKLTDETQSNQFNPNRIPNDMYTKSGFVQSEKNDYYFRNDKILTRERYVKVTLPSRYLNSP